MNNTLLTIAWNEQNLAVCNENDFQNFKEGWQAAMRYVLAELVEKRDSEILEEYIKEYGIN